MITTQLGDIENMLTVEDSSEDLGTCYQQTLLFLQLQRFQNLDMADNRGGPQEDGLVCEFNFNFKTDLRPRDETAADLSLENVTWFCNLADPSQICDGVSQCQTDECNCKDPHSHVFYCADGSGCIAWDSLCNEIQDCNDGSDECFCSKFVVLPLQGTASKICVSEDSYCSINNSDNLFMIRLEAGNPKCSEIEDLAEHLNPLHSCLKEAYLAGSLAFSKSFSEYCTVNCSHVDGFEDGWERFCIHIGIGYPLPFEFHCDLNDFSESLYLGDICDGEIHCGNQADEMGCPGRFYCSPDKTAEWVDEDKVCDNVKDCLKGADECGICQFEELSSSAFLIKSKVVFSVTVIMGFLIISLNIREGYKCWNTTCSSKVYNIDKVFLIQIFFHDTLTGVYLCCIVAAAVLLQYKGDYCQLEEIWRASPFCSFLGVLFSFSSHGSLMLIAFMSITRFLSCYKMRTIIIGSIFMNILNLLHSALPLIPVTAIKDIFRTEIFFTNLGQNPFFSTNPINRSRLSYVHKGMFQRDDDDIYNMIRDLTNVTTNKDIFDVEEISYYGNTGFCVHNIFKSQDSYEIYKILYCASIAVLLSIVIAAYIKIILKQRRYNRVTVPGGAEQDETNSASSQLTLKVALMIGSQLLCWIPFILSVLYFQYIAKKPASPMVFEVFALVVIPINSFLNPVFPSELYQKAKQGTWGRWRVFVSTFLTLPVTDMEVTEHEQIEISQAVQSFGIFLTLPINPDMEVTEQIEISHAV